MKSFNQWLKQLDRVAKEYGYEESMIKQTGTECWRDYFNDGLTPIEAFIEDLTNA
jgi:hypothetical protein